MFEILFAGWVQVAALVLFISAALISIVYMIARALNNDDYKKWAQNEIYQVIASALILGSLLIFLAIINNILIEIIPLINSSIDFQCTSSSCTYKEITFPVQLIGSQNAVHGVVVTNQCEQGYCHIEIAKSMLRSYFNIIRFYLANKIADIGWVSILKSITISIFSVKLSPLAGLQPILDIYSNFIKFGTYVLFWLKGNEIFLSFVSIALFPSFLIAGIALRSISLFRGVGGLLISIAVGTFFVYPMLLIFVTTIISPDPSYYQLTFTDYSGFVASLPSYPDSQTTKGNLISSKQNLIEEKNYMQSTLEFYKNVHSSLTSDYAGHSLLEKSFYTILPNGFLDSMAFLSVWVIIPAIISIYALLIFIKEFSTFIGGDIDIAGLSKLI